MRRALTITETLLCASIIGLLLGVAGLGVDTVRQDLKRRQTENLLAILDRALTAYQQAAGKWPANSSADERRSSLSEDDGSGSRIVGALAAVPESLKVLDHVPSIFRMEPAQGVSQAVTQPWAGIRDAWGRPLCCLTADCTSPSDAEALAANGGKPIFISAGPDGLFGRQDPSAAADNLRSDGR
ncbi:MAG TPA: hypothetical protein VLM89_01665 [Phycisphaerae bacterium]|nr:hypothetical protein [Phycisphaerae bacterium]